MLYPSDIARVCYEANREYCILLGDKPMPHWHDAPDWQRSSTINGVIAYLDGKILTAEEAHDAWLKEKMADGWKWGRFKNGEKKEHPNIQQFASLPLSERRKDHLFLAIVRALANPNA